MDASSASIQRDHGSMVRNAFAIFLAAHGIVHWIGFAVPWGLLKTESFTAKTTILAGQVDVGDGGTKLIAVLWLPVLAGFVVAAWGVWRATPWSLPLTLAVALASLVLCVLAAPQAILGVVIDVAIVAAILVRPLWPAAHGPRWSR